MIKILSCTKNPISFIGECVGVCQNANTDNNEANFKRGVECINSDHGRAMEYADFTIFIEGYSARVIRELYTHIGGSPTRTQSSTRYVDCSRFGYYTPLSIRNNFKSNEIYHQTMSNIANEYMRLLDLGVPREDVANILPLGMETKVCLKMNLRTFSSMCEKRLCSRAYHEFRSLVLEIKQVLSARDKEWKLLCDKVLLVGCEKNKQCVEKHGCGKYPKRDDFITSEDMKKVMK